MLDILFVCNIRGKNTVIVSKKKKRKKYEVLVKVCLYNTEKTGGGVLTKEIVFFWGEGVDLMDFH